MSTTSSSSSLCLSVAPVSSIFRSKIQNSVKTHHLSLPLRPPFFSRFVSQRKTSPFFHSQVPRAQRKSSEIWSLSATAEEILTPVDTTSQEIVSSYTGDDGVSLIIQVLLFLAFASLTILTIGVVYIGVSDFLEKREREKLEKEEAAKKSKKSKKGVRAKAGPRGFGQKTDEDDDF